MKRRQGYSKDQSGLFHFHWKVGSTNVNDATKVAIDDYPGEAAWFWFNDTPAPIHMDDTPAGLARRWKKWRAEIEKSSNDPFLRLMRDWLDA